MTLPRGPYKRKPIAKFSSGHYETLAKFIMEIDDQDLREKTAIHFGRCFNRRSEVFDFGRWRQMTGITTKVL